MRDPEFLTVADVLLIHNRMVREFGGNIGMHDIKLLESAVAQPRARFGERWLHSDLYLMATAYAFHIVRNHPFVDGNKRTGLTSAMLFLELNGKATLHGDDSEANAALRDATWRLSETGMSKEEFAGILRQFFG